MSSSLLISQNVVSEFGPRLAAIVGHVFSVYVRFKGGKGVATGAGVFMALAAGTSLAIYMLLTRKISGSAPAMVTTFYTSLIGAIIMSGFVASNGENLLFVKDRRVAVAYAQNDAFSSSEALGMGQSVSTAGGRRRSAASYSTRKTPSPRSRNSSVSVYERFSK